MKLPNGDNHQLKIAAIKTCQRKPNRLKPATAHELGIFSAAEDGCPSEDHPIPSASHRPRTWAVVKLPLRANRKLHISQPTPHQASTPCHLGHKDLGATHAAPNPCPYPYPIWRL